MKKNGARYEGTSRWTENPQLLNHCFDSMKLA